MSGRGGGEPGTENENKRVKIKHAHNGDKFCIDFEQ